MREKPVVGQKLYALNIGNRARNMQQVLIDAEVVKVGRKYFEVRLFGYLTTTKFSLDGWLEVSDYSAGYKLYSTPQEWDDEKELKKLRKKLSDIFAYSYGRTELPLECLREIDAIITKYES